MTALVLPSGHCRSVAFAFTIVPPTATTTASMRHYKPQEINKQNSPTRTEWPCHTWTRRQRIACSCAPNTYRTQRLCSTDSSCLLDLHGRVLGSAWLYETALCQSSASGINGYSAYGSFLVTGPAIAGGVALTQQATAATSVCQDPQRLVAFLTAQQVAFKDWATVENVASGTAELKAQFAAAVASRTHHKLTEQAQVLVVHTLGVLRGHRRKGLARQLLAAAAQDAADSGVQWLYAYTESELEDALQMYMAFGMMPVTKVTGWNCADADEAFDDVDSCVELIRWLPGEHQERLQLRQPMGVDAMLSEAVELER